MLKIIPLFNCTVADGKLTLPDAEFARYKRFLYGRQGKYQLHLDRPLKRKNRKYENWYWSIALPMIAEDVGETDLKKLHAVFKSMFLKQMTELKGQVYEAVGSTQAMTSEQHGEFVDKVVAYSASELGIYLPPPDPKYNLPVMIKQ